MIQVFARKVIRLFGPVTEDDIENEAKAVSALCTGGRCKYIVEVLKHGWLVRDQSYYFIDMEYCEETLEDRIKSFVIKQPELPIGTKQQDRDNPRLPESAPVYRPPYRPLYRPMASQIETSESEFDGWDALIDALDDISSGLNYIHKNKFVHRDLKPRNGIKPD
jgi:serine/threonine protein kinase